MRGPITDILDRIERRVEESHGDVINALFDHIDRKIRIMEEAAQQCSYAAALADYVHFRITAHHLRKHIEDMYVCRSVEVEHLHDRLYDYERRARAVRMKMYSNVCGACWGCKTRRKSWPDYTRFSNRPPPIIIDIETSEGPVYMKDGKMLKFHGVGDLLKFEAGIGKTFPMPRWSASL